MQLLRSDRSASIGDAAIKMTEPNEIRLLLRETPPYPMHILVWRILLTAYDPLFIPPYLQRVEHLTYYLLVRMAIREWVSKGREGRILGLELGNRDRAV